MRLKEIREHKRITQAELAKALKISPSAVGMYEQGRREPDHETLNKIADFFNVSIDYLLGREKPTETIRRSLGAGKPDPKKELLYALIGKIPNEKVPMAQSLLNVLLQDDYNNMA